MKSISIVFAVFFCWVQMCGAAEQPTAASLAAQFAEVSVDPDQTYQVRDLQFSRGDIKFYLNEGVLSFVTPLAGHTVAALFTTEASEGGDAEILLLPPQRSERSSLASFTKSPNLNEHFHSAVFLFSDGTAQELLSKLERKTPEAATQNAAAMNRAVRAATAEVGTRLMEALLDAHAQKEGFFYAFILGRQLGNFNVFYEPAAREPISVGSPVSNSDGLRLQLWTAFRSRRAAPVAEHVPVLSDYRLDATIRPDLSMAVLAQFNCTVDESAGRVLALGLADRLRVRSALVDGKTAEVYQPEFLHVTEQGRGRSLLLISGEPLKPGTPHRVEVRYEGTVIRRTTQGGYFVDERNAWYPQVNSLRTMFDLTFHFPSSLSLTATGELLSDEAADGIRVVHRTTQAPQGLAGFNLGEYRSIMEEHAPYRVETYADQKSAQSLQMVSEKTRAVLDFYSKQWTPLPIHNLAVTPIEGTFGQGFPGLIYLSTLAYLRSEDRPAALRTQRVNTFFSEMMLPHEVAHQWWGNVVIPADYRAGWISEAMANYSALEVLQNTQGERAMDAVLDSYRADLLEQQNGATVESLGPVDFGIRLLDNNGLAVWQRIVYEKGTWILHMLRQRLGDEGFRRMQLRLLKDFAEKPLSNEDFERVASEFLPAGQPDKNLALFFETWIDGTGIPRLTLGTANGGEDVAVSRVDEDYTADLPLNCRDKSGKKAIHWLRVSAGTNPIDRHAGPGACDLPAFSDYLYSR